ncbi:SDR family NAD(P)-dependent oxidoreductase [Gordonia sp. (in: high G+C Gram-positive bacteria)]|uniref:SDR family NAD(P)-dependent oxidoreductase n=1 Tax=Gordonia sp. (in: high G+C Gram-positive bacteria) TaxID=84139 RepID=UPI00169D5BB9|nr:SDR family NAD(P)-dependent oxidoreductase [Gordonia sp. (in: high G+C Gram-positive bacteria)]NLG47389.1 SDR family oxidoreductase [Gordonia sp. (in: high G+C Gram-positive bacteria)]
MDVTGSAVIVTGAASGLGAATAKRFAADGATVFGIDLPQSIEKAEAVANVNLVAADVTSETEVQAVVDQIVAAELPLRVAVNCAGVGWAARILGKEGPHDLELFRKVLDINTVGTFNVMRLAANRMQQESAATDDGARGVVINTASVAAFEGQIGQIAYAASKGAVHAMTISAARDLARVGVRVCTIAPGTIATPMLAGITEEFKKTLEAGIPFPQRLGEPAEYADLAAFIVAHNYLNGETIRMDGALRMAPR